MAGQELAGVVSFLFVRRKVHLQVKEALQLDLFQPRKPTTTTASWSPTKTGSARSVLLFHYGRGSQEGVFAEAKQHAGLGLIPPAGCSATAWSPCVR